MAEQNSDSAGNCPVCSETYAELGDTVPKRLPCGHSLCEKCATLKLLACKLECPECGESHMITGGVGFIPENDRIMDRIKSKRLQQESSRLCEKHRREGRKIGLYCYSCNEFLCVLCLEIECETCELHDIYTFGDEEAIASRWKRDLQEEREGLILARKENEEKSEFCTEQIKLEKDRMLMEITKFFDELLKKVSDHKKETDIELEDMLVEIEANIAEIDDVLKKTKSTSSSSATLKHIETIIKTKARPNERAAETRFTHCEYAKSKARIQRFCGQLKRRTFFRKVYLYDTVDESRSEVGRETKYDSRNAGSVDDDGDDDNQTILSEDFDNELPNPGYISDSDDDFLKTKRRRTRQSAPRCKQTTNTAEATGIDSSDSTGVVSDTSPAKKRRTHVEEKHHFHDFGTIQKEKEFVVCELNVVELMCVLDDSVVLCGQTDFRFDEEETCGWKVLQYELKSGRLIYTANELPGSKVSLDDTWEEPWRMTAVTLDEKQCLVVSFNGRRKKIVCYEGENLKRILTHQSFGGKHSPPFLSAVSPDSNVLFWMGGTYNDEFSYDSVKSEVKQLNCVNGHLYVKKAKTPIYLAVDSINEMCCIQDGRDLLFVTENGLVACDTETGKQKWSVTSNQLDMKEEMFISGITTDAEGYFFVSDINNQCVHMFSDSDGEYLGILLKKEDGFIGVPHRIGWNHKSSLLVVTHKQDDSRFMVSIYKLRK